MEELQSSPRTSVLMADGTRVDLGGVASPQTARFVQRFFAPYKVSQSAIEALGQQCRIRSGPRHKTWMLGGSGRTSTVVFLVRGCVMVRSRSGHTDRLWKGPVFFGDEEIWNFGRANIRNSRIFTLSNFMALVISTAKLREIATEDPTLAFALLRMSAERRALAESVYGQNRKSPLARVATLLDYLAEERTGPEEATDETGATIVRMSSRYVVDGPSQTDLSDALGLGRATVEKSLALLRQEGAVKRPERGTRQNRTYEINDVQALREISLGVSV
ncbi:Crp/Fnr family transcriptional regulator [Streptomyces cynarae]|uniref:Crp/Fnr family transcriptional regulator n=1 Tax=Streptomyces cynarae TaxID=2981134 RepID=UPI00406C9660